MGAHGRRPLGQNYLGGAVIYWRWHILGFFFFPLLSSSNKQIQWIYVPRVINVLVIWNINKETSLSEDYSQTTCISSDHDNSDHDKNTRKVWKKIGIKLQDLRTQGTHYPYTLIVFKTEKWLSSKCGKKVTKKPVQFQKDRHKTVGEVAHTRVSNIHTLWYYILFAPQKWLSLKCGKYGKKN